jgi:hypothetical protein
MDLDVFRCIMMYLDVFITDVFIYMYTHNICDDMYWYVLICVRMYLYVFMCTYIYLYVCIHIYMHF